MKNLYLLSVLCLFLIGCKSTPMSMQSVYNILKVKPGTKLYTAYNIKHNGRGVPASNYQSGSILPFGSEVKIISVNYAKRVRLKAVKTGEELIIGYDDQRTFGTFEEYLKDLLITKSYKEQSEGISPKMLNNILSGTPIIGMTRKELLMTCGYPPKHRTPSLDCNTWIYFKNKASSFSIILHDKKVIKVNPANTPSPKRGPGFLILI